MKADTELFESTKLSEANLTRAQNEGKFISEYVGEYEANLTRAQNEGKFIS